MPLASYMVNAITMNLHMKFAVIWIIIPVVSLYQHNIYVSEKLSITKCQQINNTTYRCSSITEVFQQLSNCCNSTDITIEPGNYNLALSYELADLHDIRIRSETKAVIQCAANVNGTFDFDTGIAFVRVRNLIITNISIVGCGMKHNSSNHIEGRFIMVRSALYIQNSTNISLDNMIVSKSNGMGLLVYDTNGSVSIRKSFFINNTLNLLEQNKFFSGGGGLYIEFTHCSPGIARCNSTSNYFNKFTKYRIEDCEFEDNTAFYQFNTSTPEDLARGVFITFGTGGGLSLWLYGHAQYNSFQVTSTNFISNTALFGGGLYVHNRQNTRHNRVQVWGSTFFGNIGKEGGGGLLFGYGIYQVGGQSLFNTYMIANCWFERNQGPVGGGMIGFGSREPQRVQPTNRFEIHNSTFINNGALYGSAIQINKEYFESIAVGITFTLILNNCTFADNNLYKNSSLFNSSSIGAVAMSEVDVEFRGNTIFSNNTSTALFVDGASINFGNDSRTIFQNNSGIHGGAISLISGAWITAYPNSSVIFLRNTAVLYGGAIYVGLSTPFDYIISRVCFIRYYSENFTPSEWNTSFTFINNTAGKGIIGNTIFADTIDPCVKVHSAGKQFFFIDPFHHSNMSDYSISTSPDTFNVLGDMLTAIPGEIFNLPVQLKDELGQVVNSTTFIATCNGPTSPHVASTYHFTNGSIVIAGKPNDTCNLRLETDTNYQVTATMQITLLKCPPGFVYNTDEEECTCIVNPPQQNPAISGCDSESFRAYFDQFYWIGYESDDADKLLISPCPYGYCYEDHVSEDQLLPKDANKATLDKFVCGNRSRTGLLCGECIEGYSVALNSPTFTCYKCENLYLGILYFLLSYIIPVTIVFYIIMAYNIRMTTGPIGAFLFFSQIISSQYHFAFDYSVKADSDETLATSDIVVTIYSIANLQFFQHDAFSYCLFPNAGTVDILAFNLVLSFYPVLLVLVYFLLRRYCTCKLQCYQIFRLSNKSVTHGVCAFLVLCFAKINLLAFGILQSTDISHIDGKTSYKTVVYLQGSFRYFGNLLYSVYGVSSILTLVTVIFVPTMILVFHPIMIGIARYFDWGETKCVLLINRILLIHNLKPVLDSFQGDYKDNLSFFAGLYSFLYRIIFFCIVLASSSPDMNDLLLLMTAFFMIILLVHVLVMPFKSYIDNTSYTLVYFLMLAILIIEHYTFTADDSSPGLVWLEIILLLLPFICVVIYCLHKLLIFGRQIWKNHIQRYGESHLVSYCNNCTIASYYVAIQEKFCGCIM